jgi:hypothetical protein
MVFGVRIIILSRIQAIAASPLARAAEEQKNEGVLFHCVCNYDANTNQYCICISRLSITMQLIGIGEV